MANQNDHPYQVMIPGSAPPHIPLLQEFIDRGEITYESLGLKPPEYLQYAGYEKLYTPGSLLGSQYQVQADTQALEALRQQAGPGESPWAKMMRQQQSDRYNQAASDLGRQTQSSALSMQKALGRTGGLSGAGAARLQEQAERQQMFALQNLGAQRQAGDLAISNIEEAQRQATQQQLPTLELQALKPREFNIRTTLAEKAAQEEAAMRRFQEEMADFGRRETAAAMARSGRPSGILSGLYF
jgi:hypothetical protein